MTYSESAKGIMITQARAITELRNHGVTEGSEGERQFFADMGIKAIYNASEVLEYLGY